MEVPRGSKSKTKTREKTRIEYTGRVIKAPEPETKTKGKRRKGRTPIRVVDSDEEDEEELRTKQRKRKGFERSTISIYNSTSDSEEDPIIIRKGVVLNTTIISSDSDIDEEIQMKPKQPTDEGEGIKYAKLKSYNKLKEFLKNGGDPDYVNQHNQSIISIGLSKGDVNIVKLAIKYNADLPDNALHLAVKSKSVELVRYLVEEYKIPLDTKDKYGKLASDYAVSQKSVEILEILNKQNNNSNTKYNIWKAAGDNDLELMQYLINTLNYDVNQLDKRGHSTLYHSIVNNHLDMTLYLLDNGYVSHNKESDVQAFRILVQDIKNKEMIMELAKNPITEHVLVNVVEHNSVEVLRYLYENNTNINIVYECLDLYNWSINFGAMNCALFLSMFGIIGAENTRMEKFYSPFDTHSCRNKETMISGDDTDDPKVLILTYSNEMLEYEPFCFALNEIHIPKKGNVAENGWFSETLVSRPPPVRGMNERGHNQMLWRIPTDKPGEHLFTSRSSILSLVSLLEIMHHEPLFGKFHQKIGQMINYIMQHIETLPFIDTYDRDMIGLFESTTHKYRLTEDDRKILYKFFNKMFDVGFYMRRWNGDKTKVPMSFRQTGNDADREIVFNSGISMKTSEAVSKGVINEASVAEAKSLEEVMKLTTMRDKLSVNGSSFLNQLAAYNAHYTSEGAQFQRTTRNIGDLFYDLQYRTDSDRSCIQLLNPIIIGTSYVYLNMLYDKLRPELILATFRFMHY